MMTSIVRLFSNTSEARTNQSARVTLVIIQRVLYNNPSHTRILLGSKPKYKAYEEEEPKHKQTNVSTSLEPEIFFLDLIQH